MGLSAVKWRNWALTSTASILVIALFNRALRIRKRRTAEKQLAILETTDMEVFKQAAANRNEEKCKISNNNVHISLAHKLDRVCYKRTGILTRTDGSILQIDFEIEFDSKLADHLYKDGLNIGSSVIYIGYRRSFGSSTQVIKIINYEEETWDKTIDMERLIKLIEEAKKKPIEIINTFVRSVGGEVVAKTDDHNLIINICGQNIKAEGLVNIGDYVDIDAVIGGDAQNLEDLGIVLDVLRLKRGNKNEIESQCVVQTQKHWIKINYEPLEAWPASVASTKILIIQIENQRNEALMLTRIELLEKQSGFKHKNWELNYPELYAQDGYKLLGQSCHDLQLLVRGKANGTLQIVLHFDKFIFRRIIYAVKRESQKKKFRQQYEYSILTAKEKEEVLPAPAFMQKRRFIAHNIDNYDIPTDLMEVFFADCTADQGMQLLIERYSFLKYELNAMNYKKTFQLLLHMEELTLFSHFRQYDCANASFKKEGEYLSLDIENLQERRPSLTVGDTVRVMHVYVGSQNEPLSVEGVICKVLQNCVYIKFNENFHNNYNKEFYKLQFHYSRYVIRKFHHAVGLMAKSQPIFLFPKIILRCDKPQLPISLDGKQLLIRSSPLNWYSPCLNEQQRRAIFHILKGETKMPYCIFGPPGTGKTVTVVETILQLLQNVPDSRVIVGTPSNSAIDLIAQRLLDLMPHIQFLRLISHVYKERVPIPNNLRKFCATVDIGIDDTKKSDMTITSDGLISQCTTKHLCKYRIVLGTCTTLGTMMQIKLPANHFTHAVVDEAAQCTEPEFMCVAALLSEHGQLIVAGDPKQVGPTVLNSVASDAGLSSSYMERLLKHAPYVKNNNINPKTNGFEPQVITMLIYNYRAVPSILNVYNFLFYEEELIATLTNNKHNKEYEYLKVFQTAIKEISPTVMNKDPPFMHGAFFFGLKGINMQDNDSPSWYNQLEAAHVYMLVMKLLEYDISPNHIGIISPYLKQVRLLRSLLADYNNEEEENAESLKIGTVEEFQGQERQFILISTVRSTIKKDNINASLGFLKDSRRINVAVSRARASLVVFGNIELLYSDRHWKQYIQYCYDNNSVYGDQPSLVYLNEVLENDQI